jgi:hypothetical protein
MGIRESQGRTSKDFPCRSTRMATIQTTSVRRPGTFLHHLAHLTHISRPVSFSRRGVLEDHDAAADMAQGFLALVLRLSSMNTIISRLGLTCRTWAADTEIHYNQAQYDSFLD